MYRTLHIKKTKLSNNSKISYDVISFQLLLPEKKISVKIKKNDVRYKRFYGGSNGGSIFNHIGK